MKVLKFLGIAIMATIINISFMACSDDDEDNGSSIPLQEHGKKMREMATTLFGNSMLTGLEQNKSIITDNLKNRLHLHTPMIQRQPS